MRIFHFAGDSPAVVNFRAGRTAEAGHGLPVLHKLKVIMNTGNEQPFADSKAQIDYPCVWQYKLIGADREAMQAAVSAQLGDAPYSFSESRRSSAGSYLSMNLEVTVESDEHRQTLHRHFAGHPAVRLVL